MIEQFSSSIALTKTFALIQSGEYIECQIMCEREMIKCVEGRIQWYLFGYYRLKALMYGESYEEACRLLYDLLYSSDINKCPENLRELISINLGYVYWLKVEKMIDSKTYEESNLPEFKISKFINTSKIFTKDKQGINISILILEILILVHSKKFSKVIDKMDSIKDYSKRYIKGGENSRNNLLVKLIIELEKANFNPIKAERNGVKHFNQLISYNLSYIRNIDIEIIPFEKVWKVLLGSLKS